MPTRSTSETKQPQDYQDEEITIGQLSNNQTSTMLVTCNSQQSRKAFCLPYPRYITVQVAYGGQGILVEFPIK